MKLKIKYCFNSILLIVVILFLRNWLSSVKEQTSLVTQKIIQVINNTVEIEQKITIVIRYNRDSPNEIALTINTFIANFPKLSVIVVSDTNIPKEIYHTFKNLTRILCIPLKLDLMNLIIDRNVLHYVKTKYIFVVPSGTISFSTYEGIHLMKTLNESKSDFIAVPFRNEPVKCLKLKLNLLQWMILYENSIDNSECNSVKGYHGIFMYAKTLAKIAEPFLLPFPEAFYIQATAINLLTKLISNLKLEMKINTRKLKFQFRNQIQRQILYKNFKIKKVVTEDKIIEWYGCTRKTPRCFTDIINSTPEYLNQGRWSPPCCLKVLRETVHHVFKVLEDWNVTYWLEGGSLLGAVRMKDVLPWDYDVDIGVYLQDINKCPWLQKVYLMEIQKVPNPAIVDDKGFLWEKSNPKEGDFYRVQASEHNHMHVDLFPFFSRNGIMTKKTWFSTHPQDTEFPEHYLKPLSTVEFAGIKAPAPNNVKEFLELKFGKGCVENPQYPNPILFPFPTNLKHLVVNDTFSNGLSSTS